MKFFFVSILYVFIIFSVVYPYILGNHIEKSKNKSNLLLNSANKNVNKYYIERILK